MWSPAIRGGGSQHSVTWLLREQLPSHQGACIRRAASGHCLTSFHPGLAGSWWRLIGSTSESVNTLRRFLLHRWRYDAEQPARRRRSDGTAMAQHMFLEEGRGMGEKTRARQTENARRTEQAASSSPVPCAGRRAAAVTMLPSLCDAVAPSIVPPAWMYVSALPLLLPLLLLLFPVAVAVAVAIE